MSIAGPSERSRRRCTRSSTLPWGRAWLKTIETSTVAVPNPLLPKARSIARNDGVILLSIHAGQITATVTQRRATHSVHIQLSRWDDRTSRHVTRLLSDTRADSPSLTPEDLPDDLEAVLNRERIAIAVPAE